MCRGATVSLALLLAACGGGTEGLADEDRVAEFAALSGELGALFNTGYTGQPGEMPSTGTASFQGYAGVTLNGPGVPLTLIGDATIDADFETRTLAGTVRNVFGDQDGRFGDYIGSIAIVNGEIGYDSPRGTTVPNDVRFDYAGAVTGQGNTVILDGSASGKFKGTPIQGILASSAPGETERLNGVEVPATFSLAVEKQ